MIKIEGVSKIYNLGKQNEFYALNNASLKIDDGELVAIVGKSGAGKSVTIKTIMARSAVLMGIESLVIDAEGADLKTAGRIHGQSQRRE